MPKNPKFKPTISRVRLNPEQAVLTCDCYNNDRRTRWEARVTDTGGQAGAIFCNICEGRGSVRHIWLPFSGGKANIDPSNSSS